MPRRILVLNERDPRSPMTGGAETHIFEIFRRLVARGHDVTVLAASFPGSAREELVDGVRVRRLANRYLYYFLVARAARREARQSDVVVDVLNKLPFFSPWLVPLPCLAIVHHLFGTTAFRQVSLPVAIVSWLLEKLIPAAYRSTPMLAISPSTRADLAGRGLDPARIEVVPPGIDRQTHLAVDDGLDRDPIVLWIGRLEPYKRADVAIDAMLDVRKAVPDVRLVIVGAGSARESLEARVREQGLDGYVRFTGYVSEEDKIEWIRGAQVVVQTSEKEGWGMTVIEANVCNTVAIASNVPGLRDSVRDGETGLLVEYGNTAELAHALVQVLTDRELRSRLIRGGSAWGMRFDWDEVAVRTEEMIERAIAAQHAPGRPYS
ncbi:MAG TPA: glycosyltransferase family 4 protein [Candidatus Limnocylindrales bacterium]|nr:glycosyltransferase family 4 protein [Candidatus Limnocylindrales bacterium]